MNGQTPARRYVNQPASARRSGRDQPTASWIAKGRPAPAAASMSRNCANGLVSQSTGSPGSRSGPASAWRSLLIQVCHRSGSGCIAGTDVLHGFRSPAEHNRSPDSVGRQAATCWLEPATSLVRHRVNSTAHKTGVPVIADNRRDNARHNRTPAASADVSLTRLILRNPIRFNEYGQGPGNPWVPSGTSSPPSSLSASWPASSSLPCCFFVLSS